MSTPIRMVDTHHHLWDLNEVNCKYGWLTGGFDPVAIHLPDPQRMKQTYSIQDYAEDIKNQNVVKSVHVEAFCDDPKAEVKWLEAISTTSNGFPHGIVANADLTSPNLHDLLDFYHTCPSVRGIRHVACWDDSNPQFCMSKEDYLKNETWLKGLAILADYGLSFDLQIWHHQLVEAAGLVAHVPKVQVILNHTGLPTARDENTFKEWKEGMVMMAKNPNVAVKISALGVKDHNWTVDSIRPYILGTIEVFGVDRCMFASNFPVDKLISDYDTIINGFKEVVKEFSREDQEKLFYDNACKYYRV